MTSKKVLLIEDQADVSSYVELTLRYEGHHAILARDGAEAGEALRRMNGQLSLVLLDLLLPGRKGLEILTDIRRTRPGLPVIVLAGNESPAEIAECPSGGGVSVLVKPFTRDQLLAAIHRGLQNDGAARPADDGAVLPSSGNAQMREIREAIRHIALSDVPVVMRGESGVGKEVLAREIHALSPRRARPFVKINCAALPSELLESELFGYERGAFTGANKNTTGKFEAANGGMILLDEIGDMDIRLQAKLLHVLQDHEFQRLGSCETVKVNVRVLAATHCDLEAAIREERFREDLYYRLNVITIRIPPLRDRKDEIMPLAEFFISKHLLPGMAPPEITPPLRRALLSHSWPGNIRELENIIRRYLVFPNPEALIEELLSSADRFGLRRDAPARAMHPGGEGTSCLDEFHSLCESQEREAILAALEAARWNRVRAAESLNIEYRRLLYKIRRLGISPSRAIARPHREVAMAAGSAPATAGRMRAEKKLA